MLPGMLFLKSSQSRQSTGLLWFGLLYLSMLANYRFGGGGEREREKEREKEREREREESRHCFRIHVQHRLPIEQPS